jgi:hypothetical protein
MPTIQQASVPVTEFPNLYVSPFGNDGVIPLYSSVPMNTPVNSNCLPCVICGNSVTRKQIIAEQSQSVQSAIANGVNVAVGT